MTESQQETGLTADLQKRYQLTYFTDSWLKRQISMVMFYAFMAFLIWLGQDSTWWTFLFGTIVLLSIWTRFKAAWDKHHKNFDSKAELLKFVQSLPEEPTDD